MDEIFTICGIDELSTHPDFKESNSTIFLKQDESKKTTQIPTTVALKSYSINTYKSDGDAYVPVTLISNIVTGCSLFIIVYNEKDLYEFDYQGQLSDNLPRTDAYYGEEYSAPMIDETKPRQEDMIAFSYNLICLMIDHFRGYTTQMEFVDNNIVSLGLNGTLEKYYPIIKELLLSTDRITYLAGTLGLFYGLSDGGHTGLLANAVKTTFASDNGGRQALDYYADFKGVLVTDGLSQYHLVERKAADIKNANCWAHARRSFSDAVKAASKDLKDNPEIAKQTVAYQALLRISSIYKFEGTLKELSPEERLKERQKNIKPLVDEYFDWVKNVLETTLPKGKTAEGLNYSLNQEKQLRVFLDDGEVPIDNSASERAIRTFCVGKKNWLFFDSIKGADSGAAIYSITETAKLNELRPYKYLEYLLTELPKLCDNEGNIDITKLDPLMPWATELPDECRKPRR